ncbi:MAG: competence/damage-inducible protein A [Rhodocyclaceae bacterium]|nr:competence/damage-inducible protein A [Rhodocyclaceae bacterium]MBX3667487.1 competence/damage-inducible protein A [Rhodocyclaceae bacterium]
MGFGLYIIGDEILSGRRQDRHFAKIRELLAARGLMLDWVQYLGDDTERQARALRASFAADDIVFSCGGIGATPDDHTRQAAAAALGVELSLHPEAEREIRARFGAGITPQRLQLGAFPAGSAIIPNPYNRIPGFSVAEHHFVPGFPEMAWPMIEWLLDTRYAALARQIAYCERSYIVWDGHEGELIPLMQLAESSWPGLRIFSLPSFGTADMPRHLELGAKGVPQDVAAAMDLLAEELRRRGLKFEEKA